MIEITWPAVTAIVAVLGLVGGLLLRWVKQLVDDAKHEAMSAHNRLDAHIKETANYRETIAQRYVTAETLQRVEEKLIGALDRLTDRLDKFMSHIQK